MEKSYASTRPRESASTRPMVSAMTRPMQYAQPRPMERVQNQSTSMWGNRAGNTTHAVVPAQAPHGSLDPIQDTIEGISAPVPTSSYPEVAGTNTSQVQSTPITAYRGSAGNY